MSEREKVDWKSFTEGPFKARVVFLPGPAVVTCRCRRRLLATTSVMSRDQLSRQRWTLSKRAARYLQSLAKSKKTGLRKSFYCKHKAKKKKRINHDELRPIKPLQNTLALQNLLMFCSSSSSLFFFYSLTWP